MRAMSGMRARKRYHDAEQVGRELFFSICFETLRRQPQSRTGVFTHPRPVVDVRRLDSLYFCTGAGHSQTATAGRLRPCQASSVANEDKSTRGALPNKMSATVSPNAAECLNPCPEHAETTVTFGHSG